MTVSTNASRLRRVVGHSCGCPFGLSSETGLLVTISFSGPDRMDNLLKDHRRPIQTLGCPIQSRLFAIEWASDVAGDSLIQPQPATGDRSNFSITSPPWRSITQERSPERFPILPRTKPINPFFHTICTVPPARLAVVPRYMAFRLEIVSKSVDGFSPLPLYSHARCPGTPSPCSCCLHCWAPSLSRADDLLRRPLIHLPIRLQLPISSPKATAGPRARCTLSRSKKKSASCSWYACGRNCSRRAVPNTCCCAITSINTMWVRLPCRYPWRAGFSTATIATRPSVC